MDGGVLFGCPTSRFLVCSILAKIVCTCFFGALHVEGMMGCFFHNEDQSG